MRKVWKVSRINVVNFIGLDNYELYSEAKSEKRRTILSHESATKTIYVTSIEIPKTVIYCI